MASEANTTDLVRHEVNRVLGASSAWKELDTKQRAQFAKNMLKVGHYLAKDPGWLERTGTTTARALGPGEDIQKRLAEKPGQVDFQASAMAEGVQGFRNLVSAVDFPQFVSGLIQGVFQAIVDASIQQMEAFGELLAATAKSVDQFASDHISDDSAREQIASRYPSLVRVERSEGASRLVPIEDADLSALAPLAGQRGTDVSDPETELAMVQAAKLEMAQQRQRMMALMVMLGINRIVVTNGRINARVLFDIDTTDVAARQATAGTRSESETEAAAAAVTWQPWGAGGAAARTRHKTVVRSSIDDSSESKATMKAQLAGDVRVNFRSETLPPEKMLDALQFRQMSALSQPGGSPTPGPAAPSGATPVAGGGAPAAAPGGGGK
jgi:hypothetical protein